MHYLDEGEGQPILMVHGQPTWSFMYRHLIRGLSPKARCIAVDHIGFGLSDKPRHWSYTPAEHAANLTALVEHLDLEPLTLVVHDWGGPFERREDRQGCALFPRMLCVPWLDELWQRREVLRGIPARLIWGAADPAFPAPIRERLASVFDECEVSIHEGIGHFVPEELGERLTPWVEEFVEI